MRWLLLALAAVGVGVFLQPATSLWSGPSEARGPKSVQPQRPRPQRAAKIYAGGIVEGAQQEVKLRFETPGRVEALSARVGDRVSKGDVLASLDTELWQSQLEVWKAKLAVAEAELERLVNGARPETRSVALTEVRRAEISVSRAQNKYSRAEKLYQKRAMSEETFSDRLADLNAANAELQFAKDRAAEISAPARVDDVRIAQASIAEARARVGEAQALLSRTQLVAPSDGLILHVRTEPGQIVGPNDAAPCLIMADVSEIRVRAFVEEFDALSVATGRRAYVTTDAKPGVKFYGRVVFCAPYMRPKWLFSNEPGERTDVKVSEVVIELENCEDLLVGLPVDVFIELKSASTGPSTLPSTEPLTSRQPQSAPPLSASH